MFEQQGQSDMTNLLVGESGKELLKLININMHLFSIMRTLEKVINSFFIALLNI